MNLLAIDTFSSVFSAAVTKGEDSHYIQANAGMSHNELFIDLIDKLLKRAALRPSDLNAVLCMGGPGSFTGLRIGYSAAKGLALSLGIPIIPVPTLDCVAYGKERYSEQFPATYVSQCLAVIEARKNACFYAVFKNGARLSPDKDGAYAHIAGEIAHFDANSIVTGPGAAVLYDSFSENLKKIITLDYSQKGYAMEIINVAKKLNLLHNYNTAYLYAGPEYIRATDAELNLNQKDGTLL